MTTISKRDRYETETRQRNYQRCDNNEKYTHKITRLEQDIDETGTRQKLQ